MVKLNNCIRNEDLLTLSSSGSRSNLAQSDISKSIMSLRRLYLCFGDLVDLLKACVDTEDIIKKKSLYNQMESSVGLICVCVVYVLKLIARTPLRKYEIDTIVHWKPKEFNFPFPTFRSV